jgi:hypothetical protein
MAAIIIANRAREDGEPWGRALGKGNAGDLELPKLKQYERSLVNKETHEIRYSGIRRFLITLTRRSGFV